MNALWRSVVVIAALAGCGPTDSELVPPPPPCGRDTNATCAAGFACIFLDGQPVCAEACQTDDDCSEGSCDSCLVSGDCPECRVCVSACL